MTQNEVFELYKNNALEKSEWAFVRNTVGQNFKSKINNILNAFNGGAFNFDSCKLSQDAVVISTDKLDLDVIIYETDDVGVFNFFGIMNNKIVNKSDVQYAFAELNYE